MPGLFCLLENSIHLNEKLLCIYYRHKNVAVQYHIKTQANNKVLLNNQYINNLSRGRGTDHAATWRELHHTELHVRMKRRAHSGERLVRDSGSVWFSTVLLLWHCFSQSQWSVFACSSQAACLWVKPYRKLITVEVVGCYEMDWMDNGYWMECMMCLCLLSFNHHTIPVIDCGF